MSFNSATAAEDVIEQQAQQAQQTQATQAQQQQQFMTAVMSSNMAMVGKFDELINVMLTENPRAIGQNVSGEFAKMS